ncbi:MAG: TlpA disulfide reductase family protein, partial [Betaproteobacteria bacterium]
MRFLSCLALILLLAACGKSDTPAAQNGQPASPFELSRLSGGTLAVPGGVAGKVVAIRFWADWCPYCRKEMTGLQPVYARLHERGLEILAVNVAQDVDTVRHFVDPLGIDYPVLLDTDGATARAYGVKALPITWLVDRHGVVRGKIVG